MQRAIYACAVVLIVNAQKIVEHLSTAAYDVENGKASVFKRGTDTLDFRVPPCFTAAFDVDGSGSIAGCTTPMKFVEQVSCRRQRIHCMHGSDVVSTLARV